MHLISRKVGVSIDGQEGYIYFALCSTLATVQIAKKSLTSGFSIQQNRLCDIFPGTELLTTTVALYM